MVKSNEHESVYRMSKFQAFAWLLCTAYSHQLCLLRCGLLVSTRTVQHRENGDEGF